MLSIAQCSWSMLVSNYCPAHHLINVEGGHYFTLRINVPNVASALFSTTNQDQISFIRCTARLCFRAITIPHIHWHIPLLRAIWKFKYIPLCWWCITVQTHCWCSSFHELQVDIYNISMWTWINLLYLNTEKCKCMLLTIKGTQTTRHFCWTIKIYYHGWVS